MNQKKLKWYQGKGNLITIASFFTFIWPVAIILMWLFATWSKRTKWIITSYFIIILGIFFVSPYLANFLFGEEVNIALILTRKVMNYASLLILISLSGASLLSAFRNRFNLDLKQIWMWEIILVSILILLILLSGMLSINSVYNLQSTLR